MEQLPTRTDQRIVWNNTTWQRVQLDVARVNTGRRGQLLGHPCQDCGGGVFGDYRVMFWHREAENGEGAFFCKRHAPRWLPPVGAVVVEHFASQEREAA